MPYIQAFDGHVGVPDGFRIAHRQHRAYSYREHWNDGDGPLGGDESRLLCPMVAATRHAARCLAAQKADKKPMLILVDGQLADVDTKDERLPQLSMALTK